MIITLCGSARFEAEFKHWNLRLALCGVPCFTLSAYLSDLDPGFTSDSWTHRQKVILDVVHRRKIDASGAILVLNVGGYVGESTRSEVEHAHRERKQIFWLEPERAAESNCDVGIDAANPNGVDALFDALDQLDGGREG